MCTGVQAWPSDRGPYTIQGVAQSSNRGQYAIQGVARSTGASSWSREHDPICITVYACLLRDQMVVCNLGHDRIVLEHLRLCLGLIQYDSHIFDKDLTVGNLPGVRIVVGDQRGLQ